MFPDRFGSDMDHDTWLNECAPVDYEDWCAPHKKRGSTCGQCHAAGLLPGEIELPPTGLAAQVKAALSGRDALRREADSDEQTGAGLAARFKQGA